MNRNSSAPRNTAPRTTIAYPRFSLCILCVTDFSLSSWGCQSWPQPAFSRLSASKSSRRATKQKFSRTARLRRKPCPAPVGQTIVVCGLPACEAARFRQSPKSSRAAKILAFSSRGFSLSSSRVTDFSLPGMGRRPTNEDENRARRYPCKTSVRRFSRVSICAAAAPWDRRSFVVVRPAGDSRQLHLFHPLSKDPCPSLNSRY
jgi:hypothetical protein